VSRTPGRPEECTIAHYGGDVAALANNLELRNVVLVRAATSPP